MILCLCEHRRFSLMLSVQFNCTPFMIRFHISLLLSVCRLQSGDTLSMLLLQFCDFSVKLGNLITSIGSQVLNLVLETLNLSLETGNGCFESSLHVLSLSFRVLQVVL